MKNDKQRPPARTVKSRVSRAMKARARVRRQHKLRSLFVTRTN